MMRKVLFFVFALMYGYMPAEAQENALLSLDFDGANYTVSSVNSNTGAKTVLKSFTSPYGTCAGCSFVDEYGGKFYIGGGGGFAVYDISDNSVSYLAKEANTLLYRQMAWSGDDVISATSDDAEIKIDEANNTVNIDNAALSDGAGKNIISLETDGSVALGNNDMVVIDDEGITIDGNQIIAEKANGSVALGNNDMVVIDSDSIKIGGTQIIAEKADGSVALGDNDMVVIDDEGITINGKQLIAEKDDGAIHIGENSLITIEQGGVQKLYAEDANGDPINIDITNGSDLLINGVSVSQRLNANNQTYIDGIANSLSDGIEDSSAMGAALSALPNSAPDALAYCGGGFGAYGSSQALAMGCASNLNEKVSLNFGASVLSTGGTTVNNRDFDDYSFKAGVTYKFGVDASKSKSAKTAALEAVVFKQQSDLQSMTAREAYKDTKIAEYEDRITKLEEAKLADAAEYNNRLAKLEERFQLLTVAVKEENNKFAGLVK
jgi:hypothetical protein